MDNTLDPAGQCPAQEDLEKVLMSMEIPPCPAVLMRVMEEAQKDDADIRVLTKLIESDVGTAAAAIKLANSPLFRAASPITSTRAAVERLGIRNILCVVLVSALRSAMIGLNGPFMDWFWSRSSSLATSAAAIARQHFGVRPDTAYTYAMFHNAGVPLMLRRFPDYLDAITECRRTGKMIAEVEEERFGCTHAMAGAILVRSWGLPAEIGHAVRNHHAPDLYTLGDEVLPADMKPVIAATDLAERAQSEIFSESDTEVGELRFDDAIRYFGLSPADLDELRECATRCIADLSQ